MDTFKKKIKVLFGKLNNADPSKLRLNAGGHWRSIVLVFVLGIAGTIAFNYYTFFTYFESTIIAAPEEIEVDDTDIGKYRGIQASLESTIERYEAKQNIFNRLLLEKPNRFADPSGLGIESVVFIEESEEKSEGGSLEEVLDAAAEEEASHTPKSDSQMGSVVDALIDWLR